MLRFIERFCCAYIEMFIDLSLLMILTDQMIQIKRNEKARIAMLQFKIKYSIAGVIACIMIWVVILVMVSSRVRI